VRWDHLFADLEAQLDAADRDELAAEVRDRTRRETARLRLADRLRAAVGCRLVVTTGGASVIRGTLDQAGPDWLLLTEDSSSRALVPLAAVLSVDGLPAVSGEPGSEGAVGARLDLGYALRGLARDRAAVAITLRDGGTVTGTVDRVGADFVELAEHDAGEPRRRDSVIRVRTLPTAGISVLRSL
jgi:hypothetical protein